MSTWGKILVWWFGRCGEQWPWVNDEARPFCTLHRGHTSSHGVYDERGKWLASWPRGFAPTEATSDWP